MRKGKNEHERETKSESKWNKMRGEKKGRKEKGKTKERILQQQQGTPKSEFIPFTGKGAWIN